LSKIVHIITGLNSGGAEIMLLKLLSGMQHTGLEHSVISLGDRGVMAGRLEEIGVQVLTCGMTPGRISPFKFLKLVSTLRRLKPDIVQTWLYHADLLGGLAARVAGTPRVYWNIRHSNLDPDKNKRHTLWTVRTNALLSRWIPDTIVCNSSNSVAIHQGVGFDPGKFIVIPNGFDLQRFSPDAPARASVRKELGLAPHARLVGLIARFDPLKNHRGFMQAASQVAQLSPDAAFLLAGTDINSSNGALAGWIREAGLDGRVHLLGMREDIPRLTAALDVAVCCSWGEGFPNAIGEAMACAVPCVVTNVGDCAGIVGDTGWVVQPGDMAELARCIAEALGLPAEAWRARGAAARQKVIDRYSLPAIVSQYEAQYLRAGRTH
jgi:glycosyltransferase involved in cell wall biosynthesis